MEHDYRAEHCPGRDLKAVCKVNEGRDDSFYPGIISILVVKVPHTGLTTDWTIPGEVTRQ